MDYQGFWFLPLTSRDALAWLEPWSFLAMHVYWPASSGFNDVIFKSPSSIMCRSSGWTSTPSFFQETVGFDEPITSHSKSTVSPLSLVLFDGAVLIWGGPKRLVRDHKKERNFGLVYMLRKSFTIWSSDTCITHCSYNVQCLRKSNLNNLQSNCWICTIKLCQLHELKITSNQIWIIKVLKNPKFTND